MLGFPCLIDKELKICRDKNIVIIEDVAHAPGAMIEKDFADQWVIWVAFHSLVIRIFQQEKAG